MYKKFLVAAISLLTLSAIATEKIITVDPASGNRRTTSIVITNNVQITSTNSVAKEAVVGTASGPSAADAGKPIKAGPFGTVDPSLLGTAGAPTANQVLTAVNSTNATWQTVSSSSQYSRMYLADSSASFTNSFAVTTVMLEIWGGGGGGGALGGGQPNTSTGGGGGSGAYVRGAMSITNGQIIAFTVGAGGGPAGAQPGSSTTFSNGTTTFTAGGGSGGASNGTPGAGGAGGTATATGAETITGGTGAKGAGTTTGPGGQGASAPKGGPGGSGGSVSAGLDGQIPGGGGGGGHIATANGGSGGGGRVIVWY